MNKRDRELLNIDVLTRMEEDVIMHALCADRATRTGRKPKAYRNHFLATPGHTDWAICKGLADRGLMEELGKMPWAPYTQFVVTKSGAKAAGMELSAK